MQLLLMMISICHTSAALSLSSTELSVNAAADDNDEADGDDDDVRLLVLFASALSNDDIPLLRLCDKTQPQLHQESKNWTLVTFPNKFNKNGPIAIIFGTENNM